MMEALLHFLYGGLTVMSVAIGFFFLRYWHLHRERLFVWFMIAFGCLAAGWGMQVVYVTADESGAHVYVFRLVAFLLIIAGIIDKNRGAR